MVALLSTLDPLKKSLRRVLPYWGVVALKALWAEYSFRRFKPRVVRHRYGAYDLQLRLVDFDGQSWLDKDYDDGAFAEIALLKRHKLVPGAKVFNAGANQCVQTMMMAREVGPNGFVWAIEPNPHNAQAGLRNCQLNDIHNVQVIEAAASSKPGQLWFNRSMNGQVAGGAHEVGAHLVEVVTIDDLSTKFGPPDILYIDVEGFECEVLEGAKRTLELHAPDCFVEVHLQMGLERYGGSIGTVLSYFPNSRYDLYCGNGDDGVFRHVETNSVLPEKRFYLVALGRSSTQSSVSSPEGGLVGGMISLNR
jgi:FkbM family methyltransferase